MMQDYRAQFYWSSRAESASASAERLSTLLIGLSDCGDAFNHWFFVDSEGENTPIPLKNATGTSRSLTKVLLEGRNRRDSDGSIIEKLGFTARLLNTPKVNDAIRMECLIGCYSAWVPNNLILGPISYELQPELASTSSLLCLATAVVSSLEPDFGVVTSTQFEEKINDYRSAKSKVDPKKPRVGFITYIASDYWRIPERVPCAIHQEVAGRGNLFLAVEEHFDAACSSHVDKVLRMRRALLSGEQKRRSKKGDSHQI